MFMNRAEGYDLRGTYIKKQKNNNKKNQNKHSNNKNYKLVYNGQ